LVKSKVKTQKGRFGFILSNFPFHFIMFYSAASALDSDPHLALQIFVKSRGLGDEETKGGAEDPPMFNAGVCCL